MALFHLLAASPSEAAARRALDAFPPVGPIGELRELWARTPHAFEIISSIHKLGTRGGDWAAVFDAAAEINPEAAVALYSLGDPGLMQELTAEIVAKLREWELLGPERAVLDFGCGTGRVMAAISREVARVTGIDASERMVELARAGGAEVFHAADLSAVAGQRFDTVLAVDSMPYVIEAGMEARIWGQVYEALSPDGAWLILNYSYRSDDDADVVDYLAIEYGFSVERSDTRDFALWDGRTFLLRKSQ